MIYIELGLTRHAHVCKGWANTRVFTESPKRQPCLLRRFGTLITYIAFVVAADTSLGGIRDNLQ